jgi:hypothetical protein
MAAAAILAAVAWTRPASVWLVIPTSPCTVFTAADVA